MRAVRTWSGQRFVLNELAAGWEVFDQAQQCVVATFPPEQRAAAVLRVVKYNDEDERVEANAW